MSVYGQTAAEAIVPAQSVDQQIDAFFGKIADAIFGVIMWEIPLIKTPFIVAWLTIAAITFTLYFKFINFRQLGFSLAIVRGRYTDPNEAGEVSHFQALATALSGTVGLGNIAGVAIAISMGGPGATFWMIVAGLL
ncbi:MAG: sodium:alanine symporter family protein, partial [Opitutales bacterium]|nr:sodium:alanine symporter family protein [Opitutales bacterium]